MHIGDSPEEAAFRAEARAWLDAHATPKSPGSARAIAHDGASLAEHTQRCRDWQRVLYDGGWAGITWPRRFGGRGASPIQAAIFQEEQNRYEVSAGSFAVAIGMVGPTLMRHGTPSQQALLDPILRGEHVWCQLFSEPGSGSDLASLGTRAERDGDTWVVNGQKVWTSLGQFAEYGILLARTDPEAVKHAGITYFVVDMKSPGIEVRPLRQMTGVAHFNEVFLNDVRIPADNVVGDVHDGWRVAQTTLANERSTIASSGGAWTVPDLIVEARRAGLAGDPVTRQDLARAHIRASVLTYFGYRLRTALSRGEQPGPEASVLKLFYSQHWVETTGLAMRILGPSGLVVGEAWPFHFLNQYALRLGGGTDEVQRNVIGERALGLPREPQVDRDLPWRVTARS